MRPNLFLLLAAPIAVGAADPDPLLIEPGADLYPAEARAQGLEGDVPVQLAVAPDGALRCTVRPGGNLGALRRASCLLIAARHVFPPRVENGKPVATEYSFIVRWKLAADNRQFGGAVPIGRAGWVRYADYPSIASRQGLVGRVNVAFEISAQGRAENCRITRSNATNSLAGVICPLLKTRAAFLPALDAQGQPTRTTGWFNTYWHYCVEKRCPPPDAGP